MLFKTKLLLVSAAVLAAPALNPPAKAEAIRVNGTCEVGDCSNPGILNAGDSLSSPFDLTYSFANTDSYRLEGTVLAYQRPNLNELGVTDFVVTYLGNSFGTASDNDVLTSEFLQEYPRHGAGSGPYFENLNGTFGPGLGLASSASATFGENGHLTPSLGPVSYPPADFDVSKSGTIYLPAELPQLDYAYTLDFGQGSTPGSSITLYPTTPPPVSPSAVPEPNTIILLGTGLLGCAGAIRQRSIRRLCFHDAACGTTLQRFSNPNIDINTFSRGRS
jgi:hypothetical protein